MTRDTTGTPVGIGGTINVQQGRTADQHKAAEKDEGDYKAPQKASGEKPAQGDEARKQEQARADADRKREVAEKKVAGLRKELDEIQSKAGQKQAEVTAAEAEVAESKYDGLTEDEKNAKVREDRKQGAAEARGNTSVIR